MLGLIMHPRARKLGGRDGGLSALTDHLCAHFTLIARAACKLLVVLKRIQLRVTLVVAWYGSQSIRKPDSFRLVLSEPDDDQWPGVHNLFGGVLEDFQDSHPVPKD